jgi:hypothetical protein
VAPWGASDGDGSNAKPWDLQTALNGGALQIHPGETVWLRGGTYSGSFTSRLAGDPSKPIIVRQYPLEHATLEGNLSVFGHDVWFWGFELMNPNPTGATSNGINSRAPRVKYINLVIHDANSSGIGFHDGADLVPAPDGEVYGSIIYNNGTLNNNHHGVYVDNNVGAKSVRDNIVFNNWAFGIQVYATGPNQYLNNITVDGNIVFNNSRIGGAFDGEFIIGGSGVPVVGGVLTNNYTFNGDGRLAADVGWYYSSANTDIRVTGNYFVGGLEMDDWSTAVVTNNTIYATTIAVPQASGVLFSRGSISTHTYSGNIFYGDSTVLGWGHNPAKGPGSISRTNFASWKSLTGWTNPGQFAGGVPPDLVVVRPNAYETGRANIAIYNWSKAAIVPVDVSGVLTQGQKYVLLNVLNFYGTPVLAGTYQGGSLQVPMTVVASPAPLGRGQSGPAPGPTFNAFVLIVQPS